MPPSRRHSKVGFTLRNGRIHTDGFSRIFGHAMRSISNRNSPCRMAAFDQIERVISAKLQGADETTVRSIVAD